MLHISRFSRTFQTKSIRDRALFWVICGIVLRAVLIIASNWRIDFDEAFNGLIAYKIMRGELVLFTPPEVVGGTGTPYLLAVIFSLFGASAVTFRLVSLLWSVLYILTTGWIAKLAYGRSVAILAMGFASLAPPYMVFVGMKLWSSYIETILLGNLLLICAHYLLTESGSRQGYLKVVAGFVAGAMFWLTWLGFYYFVPVMIVLIWRGRKIVLKWGWLGILSFIVGSLPFWLFNIPRGMPTFTRLSADATMTIDQVFRVLVDFVTVRFPALVAGSASWGYTASGIATLLTIIYGIGLLLVIRSAKTRQNLPVMLAILTVVIPVIYALSPNSRNALPEFNPWGIDATGRYILMLHSVLPIGIAVLILRVGNGWKKVAKGLGVGILMVNAVGALNVNVDYAFDSPYYDRLPHDLTPLINFLAENDIHYAWTDGGIGHALMFLTGEDVLTEDYRSVFLAGGFVRQPDVLKQIQAANPTVFITPIYAGQENPPLQLALENAGIAYEMTRVTPMLAVYIIPQNIDPARLVDGLGYQY